MHDSFAAQAAEHEMIVDEAVFLTPVASLKRGVCGQSTSSGAARPAHQRLFGAGRLVTVHHALTNGAIVKLVAPFDFYLQAKKH